MESQTFVARERELNRLEDFITRAMAGQATVCFVTGEAGRGKTALVTEFARRAQERYQYLIVATGQGDAQTGAGDSYLPFRDILAQLTGDVERGALISQENAGRLKGLLRLSGQALVEVGPDLVGAFVPGVGLVMRMGTFVAGKVGWLEKLEQLTERSREPTMPGQSEIEQSHIFEQYTNVLKALAEQHPLMLVLDDLQWVDAASLELLFRLGRRLEGSPILIVGTYRPGEVALGRSGARHPLEKVLAEFKRTFGNVWIDLDRQEEKDRRQFTDALLDATPNRLGETFRQRLYQHTGGHPLFTVELLRDMQERGDLIQDDQGRWVETSVLDWNHLPVRVEGVIEERIGRLEPQAQETLTIASVEGEEFIAEVIAHVQSAQPRDLVRRLSGDLEKQHQLVKAQRVRRLKHQRISYYQFRHSLFQRYLYSKLDEVERTYYHEDVGNALEALYGDEAGEIAVQLARHFMEADIRDKAIRYLYRAGEQAATRFAHTEAVAYFTQALDIEEGLELEERFDLLAAREQAYHLLGLREEQERDLAALEELALAIGDDGHSARVALRHSNHAEATGDYPEAIRQAQRAVELAQTAGELRLQAQGYLEWGSGLRSQGDRENGRTRIEQALALAREVGLQQVEAHSLQELGILSGIASDYDAASTYFHQALDIFRTLGERRGMSEAFTNLGLLYSRWGEAERARSYYEQALKLKREVGNRRGEGSTLLNIGSMLASHNEHQEARNYLEQALSIQREVGDRRGAAMALGNLGFGYAFYGDYPRARDTYEQALHIFQELGSPRGECIALCHLGLLFHQMGQDEAARDYSQKGLLLAREVGLPHFEGYAQTYLGHALADLGQLEEAQEVYRAALEIRRKLKQPKLATEPLAGLARVSLAEGDLTQAVEHVEEILQHLEGSDLFGTDEPVRVYLTVYRVLHATGDALAGGVLKTAYERLQQQAAKIEDVELRRSFLDRVTTHREVLDHYSTGSG